MNLKFVFKYLIMTRFKFYNSSKYHLKHKKFVENKHMNTKGESGGSRVNWETGIDCIYTTDTAYKISSESLLYSTGNPTQSSVAT